MPIPQDHPIETRRFEHLAKVSPSGHVVAMVEVDAASDWQHWTDGEGNRYVYVTDLVPLDIHGMRLLQDTAVQGTPTFTVTGDLVFKKVTS